MLLNDELNALQDPLTAIGLMARYHEHDDSNSMSREESLVPERILCCYARCIVC